MIVNTNPTYKCEHCRKLYQIKSACIKHEEELCKKNPINHQRCFDGCDHLIKKETEVTYFDHDGYDYQEKRELLYCNHKKEYVYPYWIGNPTLEEDITDNIPNNVMPRECDEFKLY